MQPFPYEESPPLEHALNPMLGLILFLFTAAFMIGLLFTIRQYKRKKGVHSFILLFLMLQGVLIGVGSYVVFFTRLHQIFPVLGSLGIFTFIISLILLNVKLEKTVQQKTVEVEESEERYRNLVLNIIDVIFEVNKDLTIAFVSPQVKDLLRYKPHEMINRNVSLIIHPDDLKEVENAVKSAFKTGNPTNVECRMKNNAGEYINASIRAGLVKDNKNTKIIGVIRDITDQKKAELVLKQQYEKLKEIDQIRSDLVRRTSHELKTPLISLFSSTQYVLDTYKDKMDPELLKFIKIINRGGKRLKQLTDNLIDAYNIESKGLKLNKEKVDIVKSIKDCANDLVLSLEERDLYLKEDLKDQFFIEVDKARIEQVILNILSNAIKNTPAKGIIYIKLESRENFLDVIVKDTGIGLTTEEKTKLFSKFGKIERENADSQLNTEGSGLGLYISKEIVELHNGKILVESEGRNKGSTFIIRLPYA